MSLFFKSPIWSIEKFEAYLHQTSENIRRYRQVEQSAELQQLRELEKIVTTKEFQDNKMYLLKRKYKKLSSTKTCIGLRKQARAVLCMTTYNSKPSPNPTKNNPLSWPSWRPSRPFKTICV